MTDAESSISDSDSRTPHTKLRILQCHGHSRVAELDMPSLLPGG
jgi:hypothetical protein